MHRTVLPLLFLVSVEAAAGESPCVESLLAQPGTWQQTANRPQVALRDFAIEKTSAAVVREMVHARYRPMGMEADESTWFVAPRDRAFDASSYGLRSLGFFCEEGKPGKFGKHHEGSSSLTVTFNQFGAGELYEDLDDKHVLGFHTLAHGIPVEERPGVWHFPVARAGLGFGRTGKSELWLFTFEGKLPWSYVSRRESSRDDGGTSRA
jgi:hypothetical protein